MAAETEQGTPRVYEFDQVGLIQRDHRPVMSHPPRVTATKKFMRQVQEEIPVDVPDDKLAEVADWALNLMERWAAWHAKPMIDAATGEGPLCSLCGAPWPLCGHHHMADPRQFEASPDDDAETEGTKE